MSTQTVRVRPATHAKLQKLAEQSGRTMPDVLDEAVEALRRQQLLDATNAAYAAIREDPVAWQEEIAERALWDNTLLDGLEDD